MSKIGVFQFIHLSFIKLPFIAQITWLYGIHSFHAWLFFTTLTQNAQHETENRFFFFYKYILAKSVESYEIFCVYYESQID